MPPDSNVTRLKTPRRWPGLLPDRDANEFLPAALEIVETPASPAGRLIGAVIIGAALMALLWACLGKVDIIARPTAGSCRSARASWCSRSTPAWS